MWNICYICVILYTIDFLCNDINNMSVSLHKGSISFLIIPEFLCMLLYYCWTLRLLLIIFYKQPEVNIVLLLDIHDRLLKTVISMDEFLDMKFLDERIFVLKIFFSITVMPFSKAVALYAPTCST